MTIQLALLPFPWTRAIETTRKLVVSFNRMAYWQVTFQYLCIGLRVVYIDVRNEVIH
jgi:hypothetical protein